jgi:hypothetical protein
MLAKLEDLHLHNGNKNAQSLQDLIVSHSKHAAAAVARYFLETLGRQSAVQQ